MDEPSGPSYWAFISYPHADFDWATWLQRALETYRLPRALVNTPSPWGPRPQRLFPVFRDETELAGAPSLKKSIDDALRASRTLIVVCSPQAAASPWVDREIRRFRELGRGDKIFALLVAGEPATSFPAALREGDTEPLAVDVRAGASKHAAVRRLVAGILGLSYDDLVMRDAVRRRRVRRWLASGTAAAVMVAAVGYVGLADNRNEVPHGAAIRSALDRHDLSVFRRAAEVPELRRRAAALRHTLIGLLDEARTQTSSSWIFEPHAAGHRDPWTAAQASAGAFAVRDLTPAQEREFSRNLDLAFAPHQAEVDAAGRLYGWKAVGSVTATAEATFWTAFALELELSHAQLDIARRRAVMHELALAQSTAPLFGESPDGHFTEGPHQLGGYSTYATAMAYFAMLAAREAHVGWNGSADRREAAIRDLRGFLMRHFGEAPNGHGWLPDDEQDAIGHQYEGLDYQIISVFLNDERTGGEPVPPVLSRAIPTMLRSLELRRFDVQFSSELLSYRCRDARDNVVAESRLIEFDWYQWAIAAAAEWLHVLEMRSNAPHDDVVEARRILERLLDDGDDMLRTVIPKHNVWVQAETAYALGDVASL